MTVLDQTLKELNCGLQELAERFLGFSVTALFTEDLRSELKRLWDLMAQSVDGPSDPNLAESPTELMSGSDESPGDVQADDDPGRFDPDDGSTSDIDENSNCSDSCSSSAESALAGMVRDSDLVSLRPGAKNAVVEMVYRHKRTKMIHYGHDSFDFKTACGRALVDTYARFFGDVEKSWPHCRHCCGSM